MADYQTPSGDGLAPILDMISDIRRQLRTLQRPSGVDVAGLLMQVQQTLANITTQVATIAAAYLAANTYTRTQVDSKVANPPSGSAVTGNITATGNITPTGHVFVPNAIPAVSGYTIAYINSDGRLSLGASAAEFKEQFEPVDNRPLVAGILRAPLLRFKLIAAVEQLGDDATLEIGLLADYLDTIGLSEFVHRNAKGDVQGIQYERLTVPLIAVVQSLDARLKAGGL